MSDRSAPYYQQKVTHAEVTQWHDDFEDADQSMVSDIDLDAWGVMSGLGVAESAIPDFKVAIADGIAYDEDGQRIPVTGGPASLDLTAQIPAVGGQHRYVAIYVETTRIASDARVDGDGGGLNYRSAESFTISISAGTAGAPTQAKPAIVAGKVLLAVVELTNGMASILNANISQSAPLGDRQGGGVLWRRGRANDETAHFDTGVGNIIEANGGSISGAGGVSAFEPDPSSDEGHLYRDVDGVLVEVSKYYSIDASDMLPGGTAGHPWQAASANAWTISEDNQYSSAIGGLGWEMLFGSGSGPIGSRGLYAPIHVPDGAKLVDATVGYRVPSAPHADHNLRLWLLRRSRNGATVDMIGDANPPANERNAGVANYTFGESYDVAATQIVNNNLYRYYLAIEHYHSGAGVIAGENTYIIRTATVEYLIREASGTY